MRRVAMILTLGAALATWGCGANGGDGRTVASTSTTEAAGPTSTTTTPVSTTAKAAPAAPRPTVRVLQYAKAGETPPGQVQRLDAPAWKATGGGWRPGDVHLVVRRSGRTGVVLTAGARADGSGRWQQTFVLPSTASPGSYVAVASQGRLSAQASFVVGSSATGPEVVDHGTAAAGAWQLLAERRSSGLLCAVLKVDGRDQAQVCNAPSEQDVNGDDVLRYVFADGTFVVGISASGVDKVRAELGDGTTVERATVAASFAGSRFVALPLPAEAVVRTLVALGDNGQVFTSFTLDR